MFQDLPPPVPLVTPTVEQVVITGARLPSAAGEVAFARVRLDAGDLARNPRLDEALRQVPAVSLFRRTTSLSANPTTQGINLRAIAPSGAGRTLVTLDGVPLNDPFGGWVIWSQVPPESLQGVDLVRGGGSGPWGAGALTGVIRLAERDQGAVLGLSAGEDGGRRAVASGGVMAGPLRVVAAVAAEESDGYLAVRGTRAGAADVPLDYSSRSAAVRLEGPGPRGTVIAARAGLYDETRGGGLADVGSAVQGTLLSLAAARLPDAGGPGFRVLVWRHVSDLANRFAAIAADRSTTTPASVQYGSPATGWGATVTGRRTGAGWEVEAGLDARRFEGETRELFRFMGGSFTRGRLAGGESAVTGAYIDAAWRGGPWLLVGGIRADHWSFGASLRRETDLANGATLLDLQPADRSGEVMTGRAALRRELGEELALRLATYSSFRPPTLNELHRPFRVGNDITEANTALVPERLEGVELGLEGYGTLRWTATIFVTRLSDPVTNVTIGQGPGTFPVAGFIPAGGVLRQRRNAGRIEAVGVEISAHRDFGPLSLRSAASLTDAEVDGGAVAPQLTGLRPAQAPEWSVTFGADWRATARLTLSADGRHESQRFEDDLNSRVLAAATTLDARARYRLSTSAEVWAAADNLFDAEAPAGVTVDGVQSLAPPRTLRLGLTLTY